MTGYILVGVVCLAVFLVCLIRIFRRPVAAKAVERSKPPTSKLAEEQKEALQKWLNEKWVNPTCPMCGGSSWNAHDDLYCILSLSESGSVMWNGGLLPIVIITCKSCACVVFVSTVLSGVWTGEEES